MNTDNSGRVYEVTMIEIDCRKCKNLGDDECIKYGKDCDAAVEKCADNGFRDYKPVNNKEE